MPDNWNPDGTPFTEAPNRAERVRLAVTLAQRMNGTDQLPPVFEVCPTPAYCSACYRRNRLNAVVRYLDIYSDTVNVCMDHAVQTWENSSSTTSECRSCGTVMLGHGYSSSPFRAGRVQGNPNPGQTWHACYTCACNFRSCSECDIWYDTRNQQQCCVVRPRCTYCGTRQSDSNDFQTVVAQDRTCSYERRERSIPNVCASCRTEHIGRCVDCEMTVEKRSLYVMESGEHVCVGCVAGYWPSAHGWEWNTCPRHGRAYRLGIDELECCDPNAAIHNYSYKPRAKFRGTGPLFLGAEIEISTSDKDRAAVVAGRGFRGLVYLKEDGSVRSGFEMVTHPMSFAYWMSEFPWATFDALREAGAYEHESCGIHVHASREGFSGAAHEHRWLAFFDRNQADIEKVARRANSSYARFGRLSAREKKAIARHKHGRPGYFERYSAVNVNNEHTYEVRIFATSLNVQTVQAAIGFVSATIEYTRTLKAREVLKGSGFAWSQFRDWVADRPEYAALSAEMIRVGA